MTTDGYQLQSFKFLASSTNKFDMNFQINVLLKDCVKTSLYCGDENINLSSHLCRIIIENHEGVTHITYDTCVSPVSKNHND